MRKEKKMKVERSRKIFHLAGDKNLAECIQANEDEEFRLDQVIWTGNLDAKVPGQILTPKGEEAKTGLIHLYLVIFLKEAPVESGPSLVN